MTTPVRDRKNYEGSLSGTPQTVRVCGSFVLAGAANPTVFSSGPFVATYAGSTGQLTVTGLESAVENVHCDTHIMGATGNTQAAKCIGNSAGSNGVGWSMNIETQSAAGTAANLTGPTVFFEITYRKGALKK